MLLIDNANEKAKEQAPSIIHHDGTARVQTVTRALNQRFYDLIAAF
jgi:predicted NodU family carbamoyl transferase